MRCPLCTTENAPAFKARLVSKYDVSYFSCGTCGFVHTQDPFWLSEVYGEAYTDEDTGALQRNLHCARIVPSVILSFFDPGGKFLDFGGGHGVFARLMRDQGFNFYWRDLHAKNLFCRGFEFAPESRAVELVTCIECFEHFARPLEELEEMLAISSNIFFTTDLLPQPVPLPNQWYYYAPTHGQHVSFYSPKTLLYLAGRFGLNAYSNGIATHLFTKKKISGSRFKRALRPGPFLGRRIGMAVKSRTKDDEERVTAKKTGVNEGLPG